MQQSHIVDQTMTPRGRGLRTQACMHKSKTTIKIKQAAISHSLRQREDCRPRKDTKELGHNTRTKHKTTTHIQTTNQQQQNHPLRTKNSHHHVGRMGWWGLLAESSH